MVKNLITEKYYSKGLLIRREYIIVGERERRQNAESADAAFRLGITQMA